MLYLIYTCVNKVIHLKNERRISMRKITIEDLANKIRKSISSSELATYYITDIPFRVHKGKSREKEEIVDVEGENKYDAIYEKLCENLWSNKKIVFWNTDGNSTYKGTITVDSTVIVEFNYCSLEGQSWLYQKCKEN